MNAEEFNSMARGYVAGNVIAKTASQNLQKIIDEAQEWKCHHPDINEVNATVAKLILQSKQADGAEYLNNLMMEELIHFTQHQDKASAALPELVASVKSKYSPCYQRLGVAMPDNLKNIKAEELCEMLGLQLLNKPEVATSRSTGQQELGTDNLLAFIAITVLVIIVIAIVCYSIYA